MTSRWSLALFPAVAAPAALLLFLGVEGGPLATRVYLVSDLLSTGAAAFGAVLAARAFGRGDYLRRAWALFAVCYGVLFLGAILFGPMSATQQQAHSTLYSVGSGVAVLVGNGALVAGMLLVGRAGRLAGLDVLVPRATRLAAFAVSLVLALLIAGGSALAALRDLLGGRLSGFEYLVSSLGDIVALAAIAPLLLTARVLRGGSLAWPWALLATSSIGYLCWDGLFVLTDVLALHGHALRPSEEALRLFSGLASFAAGALQRAVLSEPDAHPGTPAAAAHA